MLVDTRYQEQCAVCDLKNCVMRNTECSYWVIPCDLAGDGVLEVSFAIGSNTLGPAAQLDRLGLRDGHLPAL